MRQPHLLRVWGGGGVPKDAFFDLCDELGILVWQEFPLSCARYEDDPEYLRILDQESKAIIRRLRGHACLAVWCGGNELFCSWSRMTDQDLALRLLNRNTYDLDPGRSFLMTSPLDGMSHGGYVFHDSNGTEAISAFHDQRATAYTEFGSSGITNLESLVHLLPESERFPPKRGTAWQTRHGFGAWAGEDESWLMLPQLEHYFGKAESLEALVEQSRWLQGEGLRAMYEEARRQKPRCSMALCWCFNEPWPGVAGNNLVAWPANPKPCLGVVKEACRPTLASARFGRFCWHPGERFEAEMWLLHDSYEGLPGGVLRASILVGSKDITLGEWEYDGTGPNTNLRGPVFGGILPSHGGRFELVVEIDGFPECSSTYALLLKPGTLRSQA